MDSLGPLRLGALPFRDLVARSVSFFVCRERRYSSRLAVCYKASYHNHRARTFIRGSMGRRWQPSIADQLEDVADSLLNAAYAVTAIAEQLREKSAEGGKQGTAFSKDRRAGSRRASKPRKKSAGELGSIL